MKKIILFFCACLIALLLNAQTTLILQPDAVTGKDAWVWSYSGSGADDIDDLPYSSYTSIDAGFNDVIRCEMWDWGLGQDTIRAFIGFDISSIPAGAVIASAKLSLFFYANPGYTQQVGSNAIFIKRIISNWAENTITWKNQPTTTSVNQVAIPQSTSTTQNYVDMNVTTLLQDMVNDPGNSFGFMLKMQNEVIYKGLTFASSNHANFALHPKLEITYNIVGINERTEGEKKISVFPNPVQNELKFDFFSEKQEDITIEVYDVIGKLVKEKSVTATKGNNKFTLDLTTLAQGMYVLRVKNGAKELNQKFVKK